MSPQDSLKPLSTSETFQIPKLVLHPHISDQIGGTYLCSMDIVIYVFWKKNHFWTEVNSLFIAETERIEVKK